MKRISLFVLLAAVAVGMAPAQGRATMDSPVVRGTPDTVTVVARFKDFSPDGSYRIGVGSVGDLSGLVLALENDAGESLKFPTISFDQGYTGSWWAVDEVKARGYIFENAGLGGKVLTLKAQVPRDKADAAGRFFVFVAKKYGPTTWYLEDGAELKKTHW